MVAGLHPVATERGARLLTPDEFRRDVLGNRIGRATLYELIRSNRIRAVRVGRKLLIPAEEGERFIARELGELN